MDIVDFVHRDLALEGSRRRLRAIGVLFAVLGLAVSFPAATGFRDISLRTALLALGSLGLLIVAGATSYSSRVRLGERGSVAIALAATLFPWLATEILVDEATPFLSKAIGCFVSVVLLGFIALLAIRFGLGPVRRKFGGARELQGAVAAIIGPLAVALHCPLDDMLHLSSHVAAAAMVAFLLHRIVLPSARF